MSTYAQPVTYAYKLEQACNLFWIGAHLRSKYAISDGSGFHVIVFFIIVGALMMPKLQTSLFLCFVY